MNINPLSWLGFFVEQRSASVLRERLAQAKDRIEALTRENEELKAKIAALATECDDIRLQHDRDKAEIAELRKRPPIIAVVG